jgi:hypothetical protein
MQYDAGIDVSLEQSSVCVVDAAGKIVKEAKVATILIGNARGPTSIQPNWNCYLESFAAHARILEEFMTDKFGSRRIKANDFIDGFEV